MAPTSSSTANDTSQSSSTAANTSQTSTTDEETTKGSTSDAKARTVICKVAKEIPTMSDEQCRIIHEEIAGVLPLDEIQRCFSEYQDTNCTGSYTSASFRDWVKRLLDPVTVTFLDA